MEESELKPCATTTGSAHGRKIGPYLLLRELGRGGAATVYKAIDTRDGNSVVALKALASVPYHEDQDQMALLVRMEREARAVEGLSHPHIVRIIEVGFAGDSPENLIPYFAMEFLSGETLRQRLDRDGALPLETAAKILDQAAIALDAVHVSGVVHRDVKPGNLMLMKDNFVKLMDFGIARQSDDATVTRAGMMVGSPAYMSPEQAVGEAATVATDIWGLSVVLFEMVIGKPPFTGPNIPAILYEIRHGAPVEIPPNVPSDVGDVLLRALNRDANRRYSIASGLAKAFRAAVESASDARPDQAQDLHGEASTSRRDKPAKSSPKESSRPRNKLVFPLGALVAAAGLGIYVYGQLGRAPSGVRRQEKQRREATDTKLTVHRRPKPRVSESPSEGMAGSKKWIATALKPAANKAIVTPPPRSLENPKPAYIHTLPRPALAKASHARGAAAVTATPQPPQAPVPTPVVKDSPTASIAPEAPLPPAEAQIADATVPIDVSLAGVWRGTYSDHPALLLLNKPSPDDGLFDGTLTVRLKSGSVVIDVRGRIGENGRLQFHEQKVISGSASDAWSLGAVTGSLDTGGALTGGGRAANGHAYGWDFHR